MSLSNCYNGYMVNNNNNTALSMLGQKEISALRLMYETYSQNPTYGDKKNFQGELETATFKVRQRKL